MFGRHYRFLVAFAAGLAAGLAAFPFDPGLRILIAADVFYASYLGLMIALARATTIETLQRRASIVDEGLIFIVALTALAVVGSLSAVVMALHGGGTEPEEGILALLAVPLGWATIHMLAAFHYAHEYYRNGPDGNDQGGITFDDTPEPGIVEFLYFAYVIGMTAQVADTNLTTTGMRRAVLAHAIASFFYNTALLALAVNAGVTLAS